MIITLKGADFSQENIGTITLPKDLNEFTLAAISASGNTMMDEGQMTALDNFFTSIGAIDGNGIYAKLDLLLLPMICADVSFAFVNYVGNTKVFEPTPTNYELQNGGIKALNAVAQTTFSPNRTLKNASLGIYTTESYDTSTPRDMAGMILRTNSQLGGFRVSWNGSAIFIREYIGNSVYVGTTIPDNTFKGLISCVFRDSSIQQYYGAAVNTKSLTQTQIDAYQTATDGLLYMNEDTNFRTNIYSPAVGAMFCGAEMTTEEISALNTALNALYSVFH